MGTSVGATVVGTTVVGIFNTSFFSSKALSVLTSVLPITENKRNTDMI